MASSSSRAIRLVALVLLIAAPNAWATLPVEAVRPLVERLYSANPASRSAAQKELLALGPDAIAPLLEIYAKGGGAEAKAIHDLLPKYGPGAIEALYEAGVRDFGGMDRRVMWEAAVDAVVRMGDPAVPVIVDGFTNPASVLFGFCTRALAVMQEQDRRATLLLIPLLDSPKEEVRKSAAALLANFPDARAYDALVAALKSEDSVVRMYAAQGLGNLRDPRAVDALISSLGGSWGERRAAAASLGRMYDPRFRIPLGRMARNDSDSMVRDTAANVLIYSDDPLAIRLGRRYKPIALSPARERAIQIRYFLTLVASFGALSLVALVGLGVASQRSGAKRWAAVILPAGVLTGFGFAWGGLVPQVTVGVEHALLLLVAPAAAAAVYLAALAMRFDHRRLGCLVDFSSFYLGYCVGWLWGYLQR